MLLVVLMAVSMQLIGATAGQRRAIRDRRTALAEASNVMERLSIYNWDELTPKVVADFQLSDNAREVLAECRLKIEVAEVPDDPDARRITVEVAWQDSRGRPARPVRLVAWRYRVAG